MKKLSQDYVSPTIKVRVILDEDIVTASTPVIGEQDAQPDFFDYS